MIITEERKIPIYDVRVTYVISDNDNEITEYLKSKELEPSPDYLGSMIPGWRIENDKKYFCLYLVFKCNDSHKKLTAGTIAHEVYHLVITLFDYLGETQFAEVQEPQAYLTEYVINEIYDAFGINNLICPQSTT